jgi:hypothetical protein
VVQAGRLADVLAPAADIVDQADGAETAVVQLHAWVDTLRPTLSWPDVDPDQRRQLIASAGSGTADPHKDIRNTPVHAPKRCRESAPPSSGTRQRAPACKHPTGCSVHQI